ncbi:MAG: orotate phosphoribosyltransferase [Acidobacteriota bacterium]
MKTGEIEVVDPLAGPILSRLRQAAALMLWESRAIRVAADEPFELASGNRSPIYVDCRRMISEPGFMRLYVTVASLLLERRGVDYDVVAGGETAGIPYASYLAAALGKPCVYLRKKAKGYGTSSRIEGRIPAGARVLLVEDLITDGGSKLSFLDAIAAADAAVRDVLVLFDRQQGGDEVLRTRRASLHSVIDRDTAFAVAASSGLLDDVIRASCDEYFRDPVAWHRQRGYAYQDAG